MARTVSVTAFGYSPIRWNRPLKEAVELNATTSYIMGLGVFAGLPTSPPETSPKRKHISKRLKMSFQPLVWLQQTMLFAALN